MNISGWSNMRSLERLRGQTLKTEHFYVTFNKNGGATLYAVERRNRIVEIFLGPKLHECGFGYIHQSEYNFVLNFEFKKIESLFVDEMLSNIHQTIKSIRDSDKEKSQKESQRKQDIADRVIDKIG